MHDAPAHALWPLLPAALLTAAAALAAEPPGQMLRRRPSGEMRVVASGLAAATIVAPDEPAMAEVAREAAAHVCALTEAELPVVDEGAAVEADGHTLRSDLRDRSLILVGNALNNRIILALYGRWLDAADGKYPGGEGYELRTVVNPFGPASQVLVLGASTPEGARAGLEALKGHLDAAASGRDLVLPQLLEVRVGDELRPTFEQAVSEVRANPTRTIGPVLTNSDLANFAMDALRYSWTGERAFAERAAGVLREMNARFDGEYYHGDVRTCDDYALEYAVRGWWVLQHAGVLTPEELWETDRNLYRDFPYSAHEAGSVGSRHLASGSMAWFLALDGLLTYGNPDAEARRQLEAWREGVRAYFHGACRTYRGDVDQAQDYGALENVFRYAIHDGHWEYFTSGWADRTIAQMLMNVDNLGWYSGVGGYGESMPGSLNYPVAIGVCLPITAMFERRGDLRWIRENVPNLGMSHLGFQVLGVHAFDMGAYVPAEPPQGALTGLTELPLSEYHWNLGQSPKADGVGPVTTPLERCVDKVMLREGFGRLEQYLLLNGFQNTVMGCLDGNAIVRFCDQGEVCLFQSTQEEGHDTKNAVWVSNGRNDDPLEGCVERGPMADLGEACFSATTLPRYHGTDWERNLFWRKGGVLVVLDRLTLREPGDYVMACTWRSPRYARLTEQGAWQARTERGVFTIAPAATPPQEAPYPVHEGADGQTTIEVSPASRLTSSLGNDRYSAEVPWVLREWRRLTVPQARVGSVVEFQNAAFLSTEEAPQSFSLQRVADGAALLGDHDGEGGSLLTRGPQRLGGTLAVNADFGWLAADGGHVAGLRSFAFGKLAALEADAGVDVAVRLEDRSATLRVVAREPGSLTIRLPDLRAVRLDGVPQACERGETHVAVSPGTHEVRCEANVAVLIAGLERTLAELRSPGASPRQTPRQPRRAGAAPWPLKSAWTFDGLASVGRRERNLTITSRVDGAEPRPGPHALLTDTFMRHTVAADAVTTWPADRVELTLELPALQPLVGLALRNYHGTVDFDQTRPNPLTVAEVAVSSDGFQRDVRVLDGPVQRRYQYLRGCYGSQFFSEVIDRIDADGEPARAVRVTLTRPENATHIRLGAVELLVAGPADSAPLRARNIRWAAEEPEGWAVWDPDRGQLAILDARGRVAWAKDLSAAITGLACDDADGDGRNELAVTAADGRVRLFDRAGGERLVKDWRGAYEATGGKYYYGPVPHGVGFCPTSEGSARDLAIGHYYFLSTLGLDGTIRKTLEGTACYWQDFIDSGFDLNGNGATDLLVYPETPWQTRVPVVSIDGATQELGSPFVAYNGGAQLFRMLRVADEDCVAVGSHKGCGIYSLTQGAYKWSLAGEVFRSSFFLTDLEGDGSPEMLIGQRDGLLLAVNLAGEIVRRIDVGDEVLAVGAVATPRGRLLLASTSGETSGYNIHGRLVCRSPLVAQRFEPASEEDGALLALHRDGRVELLRGE